MGIAQKKISCLHLRAFDGIDWYQFMRVKFTEAKSK